MISHEGLLAILHYDPETGIFTRKISLGGKYAGTEAGTDHSNGYRQVTINKKKYFLHRLAWFYVHGEWPPHEIDHINGIRNDNRLCNLRCVTHKENLKNLRIPKNNTSGVVGVSWSNKDSVWTSQIKVSGKAIYLGSFIKFEDAVKARREAEKKYNFTVEGSNDMARS
jgi:hypothetical protein